MNEKPVFSVLYIILYFVFAGALTFIFSLYGFDFSQSFFGTASSSLTSWFSVGIVNDELPLELKIAIVFYMISTRIEVLSFFSIFFINRNRKNYE